MDIGRHVQTGSNWRAVVGLVFSLISLVVFIIGNVAPVEQDFFFNLWAVAVIFSLIAVAASLSNLKPLKTSTALNKVSVIFSLVVCGIHLLFILFLTIAVIFFNN